MFNYLIKVFITSWLITRAYTQSDIFCSKREFPWKFAISNCLNANGKPMSFDGFTGQKIEEINLRPDVTVWTSEFLYPSFGSPRQSCLCGFHYLTKDISEESENLFSYCDNFKYFFCQNHATKALEVFNNTWDNASRCGTFPRDYQLISTLKPGYYWTSKGTECGMAASALTQTDVWKTEAFLCGAYSKGAGRHFRRCNTLQRHICISSGASLRPDLYDDSCFLAKHTETTEPFVSRSYQPQWTKPSKNVLTSIIETYSTLSASHTTSSNRPTAEYVTKAGFTTKFSQSSTRIIQNTSETQISNNSTQGNARGSALEHEGPNTGTDAGIIAGIVVGVCLALAGGVVLFIFIQRRYRCLFDKTTTSKPKTNNDTSKISKQSKARTLFNNLAYDSWDHKQSQAKQSKRNNIEISNNGRSGMNQLRTGKDKELPSRGNIIYYNQSDPTYTNDLNKSQTTATSTYSFAEETEIDVGQEMSQDDYYTTISTRKGVHKAENLYNKIEPENQNSDVYDSTLCQGQSFETDDVYNKLSCKTNYGKFGTTLSDNEDYDSVGNTLKDQTTQHCTDNVYN